MTQLISFDRDMTWINPNEIQLGWPSVGTLGGPVVQTNGLVGKIGFGKSLDQTTVAENFTRSVGCVMSEPLNETRTYRVKGQAFCDGDVSFVFGFGVLDPDGPSEFPLADVVNPVYLGSGNQVDDVVAVQPLADSGQGENLLVFFVSALEGSGLTYAHMHVQDLSIAPNRYSVTVR